MIVPPLGERDVIARLAAIERAAARELGRGSATLAQYVQTDLQSAASSLLATPAANVVVVTGFFIPTGDPPAAETDGPPGAVQLAAALRMIGADVRVLTDAVCEPAVRSAVIAAGLAADRAPGVDVAPMPHDVGWPAYHAWEAQLLAQYASVTHMISIERVGPGADGVCRNMRGVDIDRYSAPLARIYTGGGWTRIAIGDGGNELGMGRIPAAMVASAVPRGERIACTVSADALIVAGVSNWGAAALVAALALLGPAYADALAELLEPDWSRQVVTAMVRDGVAIDGVRGVASVGVDGLSWPDYASTLVQIQQLAMRGPAPAG